jgi:aryl-alcohol dehydrogenase-like predicted oxidoreductase
MVMKKRQLGHTGLGIGPLVFGGNVFGWTVDLTTAKFLLDRFVDAGLNAIDTADAYSTWVPGNQGGESETIIGQWLQGSRRRDDVVLITKVGSPVGPYKKGLTARHITSAVEDSLRRLQTDHIDVYLSHYPDPETPIEETLRAYDSLIEQGKVRSIGSSNYDAARLHEALTVAEREGLPRYKVHQPEYNLYSRDTYEGPLRDLCVAEGLGVIPYFGLASGFLTGKYRSESDLAHKARADRVRKYLNPRGLRILNALDDVAEDYQAAPAEIALAWLMTREGVTAPIASATTLEQLESLIRSTEITLGVAALDELARVSAP